MKKQKNWISKKKKITDHQKEVVRLLNNFRTNIEQKEQNDINGSVKFVYCQYNPPRTPKINKKTGELLFKNGKIDFEEKVTDYESRIEQPKNENYDKVIEKLDINGWNYEGESPDKILVLANSRVAKRANFGVFQVYSSRNSLNVKEQLLDRNNSLIKFYWLYR